MSKRYGFIIDQERCIGCDCCTVACEKENEPKKGFIQVVRNQEGNFPDLNITYLPHLCNHCENPPCVAGCPSDALKKRDDGIVIYEESECEKCFTCVDACPYGEIHYYSHEDLLEKCDLCAHLIDQGKEPFCATCCEGQAIYFGDFSNPDSNVSLIAKRRNLFQLKPEMHTNPSVFYSPPKEKREL
jgi:Fe-S-cluster-containing dehydrogenase component